MAPQSMAQAERPWLGVGQRTGLCGELHGGGAGESGAHAAVR